MSSSKIETTRHEQQERLMGLVDQMVERRIEVFVFVCLAAHLFFIFWFAIFGIRPCAIINVVSASIYLYLGCIRRQFNENVMLLCYFEILLFSVSMIVVLGLGTGFEFFIFGMGAVIPLFTSKKGYLNYLFMTIGFACLPLAQVISQLDTLAEGFVAYRTSFALVMNATYYINVLISCITVMGSLFFFSEDTRDNLRSLIKLSNTDTLTGLSNRRALEASVLDLSGDYTLGMLDIDDFKLINDRYGHQMGDRVLQRLAKVMTDHVRADDIVCRWGGEEFVLCLPGCPHEPALRIFEAIRTEIEDLHFDEAPTLHLTVTIGMADCGGSTLPHAIAHADKALYLGKRTGKNRVVVWGK